MLKTIEKTPIPAAGVALGLAALGNLLQPFSSEAHLICGVMATAIVVLLILKTILFPNIMQKDMENPLIASVSATFWMALMQLSTYLVSIALAPAFALWAFSVCAHLALMVWFTIRFMRKLKLDQVFPSYFICYVGIIVASVTSPAFGMQTIGSALFWIGFALYPAMFALITFRYLKHDIPKPARPLFCIYSAPASLSIAGYLAVTPEPNMVFVSVLLLFAQAFFIFVLLHLPKFIGSGFFPSFAAMTFPFVITASALGLSLNMFTAQGLQIPSIMQFASSIEIAFATCMVVFVFIRYAAFLISPAHPTQTTQAATPSAVSTVAVPARAVPTATVSAVVVPAAAVPAVAMPTAESLSELETI